MSLSFDQAMRLAGLMPRDIVPDGRWRRCPTEDKPRKRNGAYVLHPDGRGFFKNWATDRDATPWAEEGYKPGAKIDPELIERRRLQERERRMQGIRASRELFASGTPYRPHAYLTDKGLGSAGCHHLRLWNGRVWVDQGEFIDDTWLLVPLYWRDRLVNVQRISTTGVKRQMKDAPQRSCYLILGRPKHGITVLVEGLATGLAVFQAMRHARVVVTFFADNILPVVQELKPTGSVVIAADNDWKTLAKRGTNPGIEKAANAAELIGAGVVWPKDIEGTDWADALKEWGDPGLKRIERLIQAGAKYVPTATAGATA